MIPRPQEQECLDFNTECEVVKMIRWVAVGYGGTAPCFGKTNPKSHTKITLKISCRCLQIHN